MFQLGINIVVVTFTPYGDDTNIAVVFRVNIQLLPLTVVHLLKHLRMPGAGSSLRMQAVI